eukprot:CAMPEP_0119488600 /NCGR_PEP_ID=MMETSP1344-20130328/14327_1 /TAXON_ID=236787 /ORGANISM="Florenciella parvula, Strain CCMP2471" /LENGTH=81 /DNA_ID=CAMNT_0007523565 /DNA_START=48 /DNA_END=290 /DNA_ORIENTATION=-
MALPSVGRATPRHYYNYGHADADGGSNPHTGDYSVQQAILASSCGACGSLKNEGGGGGMGIGVIGGGTVDGGTVGGAEDGG